MGVILADAGLAPTVVTVAGGVLCALIAAYFARDSKKRAGNISATADLIQTLKVRDEVKELRIGELERRDVQCQAELVLLRRRVAQLERKQR